MNHQLIKELGLSENQIKRALSDIEAGEGATVTADNLGFAHLENNEQASLIAKLDLSGESNSVQTK